jgi:methyl-accepting chemotaxis protein
LPDAGSLGEVQQAVGGLDRMTVQNAALVEQSAAAADSLKRQGETLAGLVGSFKFDAAPAAAA